MTHLYHTFGTTNRARIKQIGLQGPDWVERFETWDLPLSPVDAQPTGPPREPAGPPTRTATVDPGSPRAIGRAIVERIFEAERPADCQPRNAAVFFYPTREQAGPHWAHESVAVLTSDRIDAPLSVADVRPKTAIMNAAVRTVRGLPDATTDEADVREAARAYWATVDQWTPDTRRDQPTEVYTDSRVRPTAITTLTDEPPQEARPNE